jgi:hypothetical protein
MSQFVCHSREGGNLLKVDPCFRRDDKFVVLRIVTIFAMTEVNQ